MRLHPDVNGKLQIKQRFLGWRLARGDNPIKGNFIIQDIQDNLAGLDCAGFLTLHHLKHFVFSQ